MSNNPYGPALNPMPSFPPPGRVTVDPTSRPSPQPRVPVPAPPQQPQPRGPLYPAMPGGPARSPYVRPAR